MRSLVALSRSAVVTTIIGVHGCCSPDGGTVATTGTGSTGGSTAVTALVPTGSADCDVSPGVAFGPCRTLADCDPGLVCYGTRTGSICQPPCEECSAGQWDACLDAVSATGPANTSCAMGIEQCRPRCKTSATCLGGTECDPLTGVCVWPYV